MLERGRTLFQVQGYLAHKKQPPPTFDIVDMRSENGFLTHIISLLSMLYTYM